MKVEHRIGVPVPAEILWEVIYDLSAWPEWNPLYPEASGRIGFGEQLTLTLALPGLERRVIQPRIVDWTPNEAIHWTLSTTHGLVRSIRYLEIDTLGPESCFFCNGEIFSGLLGPRTVRPIRRAINQGFEAMGEAVAARALALWRERQGVAK